MARTFKKIKNKEEHRKGILIKRNNLKKKFIFDASKKIYRKLIKTEEFRKAKIIMFYVSKDNEVETWQMIKNVISIRKKICVPKIDKINHKLHPIMIKNICLDTKVGCFGIHEPIPKANTAVPLEKIDLVITPGIAFDKKGYRLGWGKGYYDRFLEDLNKIPKIGLAFDFQIIKDMPKDKHDVPMDMVITERRIIKATADYESV